MCPEENFLFYESRHGRMTRQKNQGNYNGKHLKLGVSEKGKESGKIYVSTILTRHK